MVYKYIYKGVRPTKMLTWQTEIEISPTEMWIFDTKKYPKMLFGGSWNGEPSVIIQVIGQPKKSAMFEQTMGI